ncbi:MFS transporter [Roseomonas fluvialis]|uniref:MFS transporter n=2 Tax=Roseomonas fluvialis TaxID=1750527 RepID=A0ABN6P9Q3_9PROT|nr:MFS transporter [Roseomonas fluvialis]
MRPILQLALGTFAVGTEAFMIAPLLPDMSRDLGVGLGAVGQLVTIYTFAYAIGSPVLTVLTAAMDRRRMLFGAMLVFALGNFVATLAGSFEALLASRVLLALAAGLFVPNANALAATIVPPARRGRALAIVNGGSTIAIALGVPIGALLGHQLGWRTTFAAVGALAIVAAFAVRFGLPRDVGGPAQRSPDLGARLALLGRASAVPTLLATMFWAMGAYSVYTYLAPIAAITADVPPSWVPALVLLWGASAGLGLVIGGIGTDRLGTAAIIVPSLGILSLVFVSLSAMAAWLPPATALLPFIVAIAVWGISVWAFFPAQQSRLIGIAGAENAALMLSLNATFMFLGFSIGAALGGLTVEHVSVRANGALGAACELLALLLSWLALRRHVAAGSGR